MNLIQLTPQSLLDKWCRTNAIRPSPVSLEVFLKVHHLLDIEASVHKALLAKTAGE